jgi:glycosyltransferase involved in cell wall biosynthesis
MGFQGPAERETPAPAPPVRRLTGGVVAYNEERNIEGSLRSLLTQELPAGVGWEKLWVVASGCRDRTVPIVERIAASDDRVALVVQPERLGKARALEEIVCRANGDLLVLLNADARASPGAVAGLIAACEGRRAPYGAMGHPVVPRGDGGAVAGMLQLYWEVHNALHRASIAEGVGTHLCDELLALSVAGLPHLPGEVINDGSFLGGWLVREGGTLLYVDGASFAIELPDRFRDHLVQRRRILSGHRQSADLLGVPPTTLPRYFLQHPRRAVALLRKATRAQDHGLRGLALLAIGELLAILLHQWDRLPPRREFVLWERVPPAVARAHRSGP